MRSKIFFLFRKEEVDECRRQFKVFDLRGMLVIPSVLAYVGGQIEVTCNSDTTNSSLASFPH